MEFVVHPEIFEIFPSLKLPVVVTWDVEADAGRARMEVLWRQTWEKAAQEASVHGNVQSHPRISPWREAMGAMGVSGRKHPSSVEALLRRALKGGEPASINPLVDFYNAVSLRHFVPVGAFDLERIGDLLELGLTRDGATFQPLDGSGTEAVESGEVGYFAGDEVLTRHFVWKQSRKGLLGESTRYVFLVSEILGVVEEDSGGELADAVLADLAGGLREHFETEPATFLVEEARPEANF